MSEKICRLCLHREGDFFDLFAPSTKELTNLVDQLEAILNFKIVNDVRLSRVICSNCYKIQAFINEFRISCSRINSYLNELIKVSAPNSGDDPWEQTDIPEVNNEQTYSDASEKKSILMKPSEDNVRSCISDDENDKNLNPLLCEENMKQSLDNSRNSSFISDGETWNKNLKTNTMGTSQPPIHWDTMQRSSSIDGQNGHFRFFKAKEIYVPTAASISNEEFNGRSIKYVRNNNSPRDSGCKDISETLPLEDEDIIELKLEPEYFLKTEIPKEINITSNNVNEAMEEDHHGNPGEFHSTELQVQNEDVVLSGSLFGINNLEEAPQMELINHGTTAYGCNPLNAQGEQNPNETTHSININKAIYVKLLEMQKCDIKLTTDVIKGTALNVAAEYGLCHFTGSDGWLHSFIRRYEIVQRNDELKLPAYRPGITLTNRYITRYCCKELNEGVYDLCCEMSACGVDLQSYIIKKCARRIAVNEGLYEFSASTSWYKSFKKCYNLNIRDRNTKFKII